MTANCRTTLWPNCSLINFERNYGVAMAVSLAAMQEELDWQGRWAWRNSIYRCVEIELLSHELRRLRSEA